MAFTTHLAVDHSGDPRPGDADYDSVTDLWRRLARPFDPSGTLGAVTGLPVKETDRLVGLAVAACDEADRLLDAFPRTIRSLATSMHTHAERCVGEIRGPVLWSETISARAASFGNPDVFICSTPSRAYDVEENQVLVWALVRVHEAGEAAQADTTAAPDDTQVRRAWRNGVDAGRFAEHPSLAHVTRRLPGPRALKKIRTGKKRKAYEPALAVLDRLAEPVNADDARALCDDRTRAQLELLLQIVHALEARTDNRLPEFRVEHGGLYSGPLQFHHPAAKTTAGRTAGIVVGPLLVDVPDPLGETSREQAQANLEARAGRRHAMVVMEPDDAVLAVERAIELARG